MKILIVAATHAEAGFLSTTIKKAKIGQPLALRPASNLQIDVLITGPGITATTYFLTKVLCTTKYDIGLNIGVCGSLDPKIVPVRVVNIVSDQFGDFGTENGEKYMDAFELDLMKRNELPFQKGKLPATYKNKLSTLKALPSVEAITVQKVHGSIVGCKKAYSRFGPVMESMEGAAFFYVCRLQQLKCMQIRAVSNKVERRNKNRWKQYIRCFHRAKNGWNNEHTVFHRNKK